jgi:hypothetical protein
MAGREINLTAELSAVRARLADGSDAAAERWELLKFALRSRGRAIVAN